jgi:hypothetical protein
MAEAMPAIWQRPSTPDLGVLRALPGELRVELYIDVSTNAESELDLRVVAGADVGPVEDEGRIQ